MSSRVLWADLDEDDAELPIPISFLADADVLARATERGLPSTREGIAVAKMLEGTDIDVRAHSRESTLSPHDLKHLKALGYWARGGFRGV